MSYLDHFSADRASRVYVQVLEQLKVKKLYRERGITARQIAEIIDEDPRAISAALAIETGDNFFALINQLRVREACRLLRDPKFAEWSAEEIGLRSGFSSRQSFYTAFNLYVGVTPKKYRKQEE